MISARIHGSAQNLQWGAKFHTAATPVMFYSLTQAEIVALLQWPQASQEGTGRLQL